MIGSMRIAAAVALLFALAGPADALASRVWISGKGTDTAGCGPIATPCRTLQFAHDQTTAGGEIDVLDPAGYGAVVITKAISIVNDGAGVAGVLAQAGGNAVTINAGTSDNVLLRGLAIAGGGVGLNGVVLNSAARLVVENCSVRDFPASSPNGTGIWLKPAALNSVKVFVTNTTISNNGYIGLFAQGANRASIDLHVDRSSATFNQYGIVTRSVNGSSVQAHISNSAMSFNSTRGLDIYGDGMDGLYTTIARAYLDSLQFYGNGYDIVSNPGVGVVVLSRVTAEGNISGSFTSYGNNNLDFLYGSSVGTKSTK